jgi:hypothetical protein
MKSFTVIPFPLYKFPALQISNGSSRAMHLIQSQLSPTMVWKKCCGALLKAGINSCTRYIMKTFNKLNKETARMSEE